MATSKKKTASGAATKQAPAHWSQHVTETSDAMDLKPDVFTSGNPDEIAKSLKSSAEHSDRRKAEPFRSAMSMLNFYINRAGHNLKPAQHRTLEKAKEVLRQLFGRADEAPVKKVASKKAASKKEEAKTAPGKKAAAKAAPGKKAASKTAASKTAPDGKHTGKKKSEPVGPSAAAAPRKRAAKKSVPSA